VFYQHFRIILAHRQCRHHHNHNYYY